MARFAQWHLDANALPKQDDVQSMIGNALSITQLLSGLLTTSGQTSPPGLENMRPQASPNIVCSNAFVLLLPSPLLAAAS